MIYRFFCFFLRMGEIIIDKEKKEQKESGKNKNKHIQKVPTAITTVMSTFNTKKLYLKSSTHSKVLHNSHSTLVFTMKEFQYRTPDLSRHISSVFLIKSLSYHSYILYMHQLPFPTHAGLTFFNQHSKENLFA